MATGGQLSRSVAGGSEEFYEFTCSPCKKQESKYVEAEVYCEECSEYLCRQCLGSHNRFEKMRTHSMLDKDKMRAQGQGQRKSVYVPTEKCEKHQGKLLDRYCRKHDEVCCITCVARSHKVCDLEDLSDAAQGIAKCDTMTVFCRSLDDLESKLKNLEEDKRKAIEDNKKDAKDTKESVLETHAHVLEHLEKILNASLNDIDSRETEQNEHLQNGIQEIGNILSKIKVTKATIDPMKVQNESKLFVNMKKGLALSNTLNDKIEHLEEAPTGKTEYVIVQPIIDIQNVNTFVEVRESVQKRLQRNVVKPAGPVIVKCASEESCNITSMCQLRDGSIVLSDFTNDKLKRLDASYRVCDTLTLPGKPIQVCISGVNELAVALLLEKEIRFVVVSDMMRLTEKKISTEPHYCAGVACVGNSIYAACGKASKAKEDCLKIYSRNGETLKTIVNGSADQPVFDDIRRIAVSEHDGDLYIADRTVGVIRCDKQGVVKATYTNDNLLNDATNCFVLRNGTVFVSDFKNNSIVQLDKNMTTATVVFGKTHGIKNAASVLVDRNAPKCLVGMGASEHILVFDIE